jgi:hypothetical protein
MEIVIIMCSFGDLVMPSFFILAQTFQDVQESFKFHFSLVIHRAKSKYIQAMKAWLDTYAT